MSFYGSVYYELVDTFYKVLVHNRGKANINFPASNDVKDEQALVAIGRKGVLDVDSGNRWIKFTADPDTTKYMIWHEKPDDINVESAPSFERIESLPQGVTPIDLYAGDVIQVSNLEYDKAGHTASAETKYYKLPTSTVEADIAELMSAVGDIHDIYPSKTEEDTESEEDVKNIGKAIGDIEWLRASLGSDKAEQTICQSLSELHNQCNTIGSVADDLYEGFVWDRTLTASIGNLRNVYPTQYTEKTICDAIGNVESLSSPDNPVENLVSAITNTYASIDVVQSGLAVANIAIEGHDAAIELLKENIEAVTALKDETIPAMQKKIAECELQLDAMRRDIEELREFVGAPSKPNAGT